MGWEPSLVLDVCLFAFCVDGFQSENLRGVQTTITFLISGIWISSAVTSSPSFYRYGTYDKYEGATPNSKRSLCSHSNWPVSARKSWPSIQALVTYVIPFIIIVVVHTFIIRKLRKNRRNLQPPKTTTSTGAIATTIASAGATTTTTALAGATATTSSVYAQQLDAKNRIKAAKSANRDLKITKVLISMTGWFVLCWTPLTVGHILSPFINAGDHFFCFHRHF